MNWTPEELEAKLRENSELKVHNGNPLPRLAIALENSKYHAQRTVYNGIGYASKKEAQHAQDNDLRIKAGELTFYLTQVPFRLPGKITYRADFVEFTRIPDTTCWAVDWIDVKGYDTPVSNLKRKQVKEIYGIEIELI